MSNQNIKHNIPCANKATSILLSDLPLHCPMPGARTWDAHPKVFLPIQQNTPIKCPYCGTTYTLEESSDTDNDKSS